MRKMKNPVKQHQFPNDHKTIFMYNVICDDSEYDAFVSRFGRVLNGSAESFRGRFEKPTHVLKT